MSLKTPYTEEILRYQKYVDMAQAEVNAGNHRMAWYLEGYFNHLLGLEIQEQTWKQSQV